MPIIAVCPYCHEGKVRAPERAIGLSATCPRCMSCFTLVASDELVAAPSRLAAAPRSLTVPPDAPARPAAAPPQKVPPPTAPSPPAETLDASPEGAEPETVSSPSEVRDRGGSGAAAPEASLVLGLVAVT